MQKHYNAILDAIVAAIEDKEMRRIDLLRLFITLYKSLDNVIDYLVDAAFDEAIDNYRDVIKNKINRSN